MANILGGSGSTIVYVDDADPLITYGTGWTTTETVDIVDGYGYPLYGTLHRASVTATFSFSYTGTKVIVFLIDDAGSDYTCTLNGVTLLDKRPPAFGDLNPIASCSAFTDIEGDHELKVTVFGNSSNPVFLDYIAYIPSLNVTSADFAYFPGGPAINLGPADPNTFALFPHSTLDFSFYGYSITLRGLFDNEAYSHTPSLAFYTIDDGEPVNFTVINSATNSTPLIMNQVLLQTPVYPLGQHALHLVFLGENDTSPIATTDIIVQNQTSHIALTPIPPSQTSSHGVKGHHIIIIAVAAASLVVIVIFSALMFMLRRRRVRQRARLSVDLLATPTTFYPQNLPWTGEQDIRSDSKDDAPIVLSPETIVVHVDSGSGRQGMLHPNGAGHNVVELPPSYDTIDNGL